MGDIERDELYRDPYPAHARARQELTFVPELDAWLVGRHADVREVLRRPDVFSSANALRPDVVPSPAARAELAKGIGGNAPSILTSDGPAHRRLRTPFTRGLSAARVAALIPFITARAEALIDSFAADGRVELMEAYASRLPAEVVARLIGMAAEDVPALADGALCAVRMLFWELDPDEELVVARGLVALQTRLDEHVIRRRTDPHDDLCSDLIGALAPGRGELTVQQRSELTRALQTTVLAGTITTNALIGNTLHHLLRHREQWEALCADPALIPAAVEEVARYDAPTQAFRRVTTQPVTLFGVDLPAGASVMVAYGSANRDPERYADPDEFDISRNGTRHMSFGHGVHACPGANLAREELRITLETLIRRLPDLRLAGPVTMTPTMIHRGPERLDLAWPTP